MAERFAISVENSIFGSIQFDSVNSTDSDTSTVTENAQPTDRPEPQKKSDSMETVCNKAVVSESTTPTRSSQLDEEYNSGEILTQFDEEYYLQTSTNTSSNSLKSSDIDPEILPQIQMLLWNDDTNKTLISSNVLVDNRNESDETLTQIQNVIEESDIFFSFSDDSDIINHEGEERRKGTLPQVRGSLNIDDVSLRASTAVGKDTPEEDVETLLQIQRFINETEEPKEKDIIFDYGSGKSNKEIINTNMESQETVSQIQKSISYDDMPKWLPHCGDMTSKPKNSVDSKEKNLQDSSDDDDDDDDDLLAVLTSSPENPFRKILPNQVINNGSPAEKLSQIQKFVTNDNLSNAPSTTENTKKAGNEDNDPGFSNYCAIDKLPEHTSSVIALKEFKYTKSDRLGSDKSPSDTHLPQILSSDIKSMSKGLTLQTTLNDENTSYAGESVEVFERYTCRHCGWGGRTKKTITCSAVQTEPDFLPKKTFCGIGVQTDTKLVKGKPRVKVFNALSSSDSELLPPSSPIANNENEVLILPTPVKVFNAFSSSDSELLPPSSPIANNENEVLILPTPEAKKQQLTGKRKSDESGYSMKKAKRNLFDSFVRERSQDSLVNDDEDIPIIDLEKEQQQDEDYVTKLGRQIYLQEIGAKQTKENEKGLTGRPRSIKAVNAEIGLKKLDYKQGDKKMPSRKPDSLNLRRDLSNTAGEPFRKNVFSLANDWLRSFKERSSGKQTSNDFDPTP